MDGLERNGFSTLLLSPEQFDHFWRPIEIMMDKIPKTWEDLTKESVVARAHDGSLQVWVVGDEDIRMVLFTQVAHFAAGSALQIIWGAGEGRIFEIAGDSVDATMEYYAKAQFCKRIDVIGRGGWEKVLSGRGFKRASIVLSRKVIHEGMQ